MKASVVSVRMAPAKMSTALATMRPITLGRMCTRIVCQPLAPMTRARSMNARSFTDSVCERMMRAVVAQLVMPMTMTMTMSVVRTPATSPLPTISEHDGRQDERQDEGRQDQEEVGHAHDDGVGPATDEA